MKFNQIMKFIHHLQVFISIQLLYKVVWGRVDWGSIKPLTSLLIIEVRVVKKLGLVKMINSFTKLISLLIADSYAIATP
jgi:hypothetical protein